MIDITDFVVMLFRFLLTLFMQHSQPFILEGNVTYVYDGDTVSVFIFNTSSYEKVRLKCIDFPDLYPRKRLEKWIRAGAVNESVVKQCYYKGNEIVKQLVLHKKVYIIQDKPWERDKYGRLLGYIKLNESFDLNKWLIVNGYGMPYYCDTYKQYYKKEGCLWN